MTLNKLFLSAVIFGTFSNLMGSSEDLDFEKALQLSKQTYENESALQKALQASQLDSKSSIHTPSISLRDQFKNLNLSEEEMIQIAINESTIDTKKKDLPFNLPYFQLPELTKIFERDNEQEYLKTYTTAVGSEKNRFRLIPVTGDGDCAFNALNSKRDDFIKYVTRNKSNKEILKSIGNDLGISYKSDLDIFNAFIRNYSTRDGFIPYCQDKLGSKDFSIQDNGQKVPSILALVAKSLEINMRLFVPEFPNSTVLILNDFLVTDPNKPTYNLFHKGTGGLHFSFLLDINKIDQTQLDHANNLEQTYLALRQHHDKDGEDFSSGLSFEELQAQIKAMEAFKRF